MRHKKSGRSLGRTWEHRKAMFRNMARSLLTYYKLRTTEAKAKELRKVADKLVTLALRNDLHAKRQAYKVLGNHKLVKKLFDEIGPAFQGVNGGFTRVVKLGLPRLGDAAPLAIIELTRKPGEEPAAKKSTAKKAPAKKAPAKEAAPAKAAEAKGEEKAEEPKAKKAPAKKAAPKKKAAEKDGEEGEEKPKAKKAPAKKAAPKKKAEAAEAEAEEKPKAKKAPAKKAAPKKKAEEAGEEKPKAKKAPAKKAAPKKKEEPKAEEAGEDS